MVIKETENFKPSYWRDPMIWRDRLPQEIRIHQLVEERRAADPAMCRHLIHMRAYRLLMRQRKYRLYLDLCTGGTCGMRSSHTMKIGLKVKMTGTQIVFFQKRISGTSLKPLQVPA